MLPLNTMPAGAATGNPTLLPGVRNQGLRAEVAAGEPTKGIEPLLAALPRQSLTTWPRRRSTAPGIRTLIARGKSPVLCPVELERLGEQQMGFEPTTFDMASRRTSAVLLLLVEAERIELVRDRLIRPAPPTRWTNLRSGPCRSRTYDLPRVKRLRFLCANGPGVEVQGLEPWANRLARPAPPRATPDGPRRTRTFDLRRVIPMLLPLS